MGFEVEVSLHGVSCWKQAGNLLRQRTAYLHLEEIPALSIEAADNNLPYAIRHLNVDT